jgi:hypothetical protein
VHALHLTSRRARGLPLGLPIGASATILTVCVGAVDGGYFPTSWGWTGLVLAWLAFVLLLLRAEVIVSAAGLLLAGGLCAFVGWVALSLFWSADVPQTVFEIERDVVYVGGVLLFLLVPKSRRHSLIGGCLAGITLLSVYALLTRLAPDRLGVFDPVAGYRLAAPIGYWNALGLLGGMGSLLALGFFAISRSAAARGGAGAALVVLLPTLYFTFSRGGWIALGIGALVAIAVDPRRLRLLFAAAFALPAPAAGILLCWHAHTLNRGSASVDRTAQEGHRLLALLLALAIAGALLGAVFGWTWRRISVPTAAERGANRALAAGVVVAVAVTVLFVGTPGNAWRAFSAPPPSTGPNLNERLFSLSGNGRVTQWRVAAHQYGTHPLLGSGAGSFERYWDQHRPIGGKVRDVHNLYLEVLAELGPVGLALLVLFLGAPLLALRRARRESLVPFVAAAYVAYLAHAAIDWDWEMLVLTLLALACGATILTAAHDESDQPRLQPLRVGALLVAVCVAAVAFVGLVGNVDSSRAASALREGRWQDAAAHAQAARRWAPWATEPLRLFGEAQLAQGRRDEARRTFTAAAAKDPGDWRLWLDLARAADAHGRAAVLARASALNPLSPEIAEFRAEIRDRLRNDQGPA